MKEIKDNYDVVIMGGGPSGSTLGALLAKKSNLKIAIFDEETFPREHIGESFAHPILATMEESGVLPKVLASDCWVKKYGGIFYWDSNKPSVTFFDNRNYQEDKIHRWSMHVDRAEFDDILFRHAGSMGVEIFDNCRIKSYYYKDNTGVVVLSDDRIIKCKLFVDASGRQNNIVSTKRKEYLSEYKNLAVWNHYLNCEQLQTVDADWNIFKEKNFSPIGCFAFEHGWVWYIPVKKMLNGKRVTTYSIGIVTDATLIKDPARNLTDERVFFDHLKDIPILKDLIKNAKPISTEMRVISNYSMIYDSFCNFDEKWIMIGDAAYFVDPLFSSGVTFAGGMAGTASLLIKETLENNKLNDGDKRDMWYDYNEEWHKIAYSFSLSIDQWYHAIAKNNPTSVFWKGRNRMSSDLGIREETFNALVDTAINQDLLTVMTSGTIDPADLDKSGPYLKTLAKLDQCVPNEEDFVSLDKNVKIRDGYSIDVPGFKASIPPIEIPKALKVAIGNYWKDPINNSTAAPSCIDELLPCSRFYIPGMSRNEEIRFVDHREGGKELYEKLKKGPVKFKDLLPSLRPTQFSLLKHLLLSKMVVVNAGVAKKADVAL